MYERRSMPLLPWHKFRKRVAHHAAIATAMIVVALGIGVMGYHLIGGLGWIDSILEASMILGGMGPVSAPHTDAAKLFASFYALFSGLMFIGIAGVMVAPVAHRILHRFHIEDSPEAD